MDRLQTKLNSLELYCRIFFQSLQRGRQNFKTSYLLVSLISHVNKISMHFKYIYVFYIGKGRVQISFVLFAYIHLNQSFQMKITTSNRVFTHFILQIKKIRNNIEKFQFYKSDLIATLE